MDIINQLQDSISKLNNEDRTYAILIKRDLYLLLNANQKLLHERTPLMGAPIANFYSVIVEIDDTIENDFEPLTKKEYDEWKLKRSSYEKI